MPQFTPLWSSSERSSGDYKALAAGPVTSAELAAKTQTDERYLREWLASQAVCGYVTYDEKTNQTPRLRIYDSTTVELT